MSPSSQSELKDTPKPVLFEKICLIGLGLIGSSIARAVQNPPFLPHLDGSTHHTRQIARKIVGTDLNTDVCARARALGIVDSVDNLETAVKDADLIIFCTPVGAIRTLCEHLSPLLQDQNISPIVSDVGSTKLSVVESFAPFIDSGVTVIPAHPIAGTENSGPDAGFAELFVDRWCIITPLPNTDKADLSRLADFWRAIGTTIDWMEPDTHDKVLSITSHIPQIIAYTAVGTLHDLDSTIDEKVFRFAASGFRDMTRLAGSDPTMWRDIYLNNRTHILDMLQMFSENLFSLQRAIRFGDGEALYKYFSDTRDIHQQVVRENQAEMEDVKQRRLQHVRDVKTTKT